MPEISFFYRINPDKMPYLIQKLIPMLYKNTFPNALDAFDHLKHRRR